MCGILGASFSQVAIDQERFADALDLLSHRGPDSTGTWFHSSNKDALGFKRLSILDLSSKGNQPFISDCGQYKIVFNGEIYNFAALKQLLVKENYVFHSNSDTEVLLYAYAAWGQECLQNIEGMFSFAIHDSKKNIIFLARDIAGQKPLYYSINNGSLLFASELKSIAAMDPSLKVLNHSSALSYFHKGSIPNNSSIYSSINQLLPSHALIFDLNKRDYCIFDYHHLVNKIDAKNKNQSYYSPKEIVDEMERLLDKSVQQQLIADVPIGVLLSGGLDSSLITAFAARNQSNLKTFSVIFPNFPQYNEQTHSRLIAERFKTDHLEINAEEIGPEIIDRLANFYDEPFSDPSMIPTFLLSQSVKEHCTVALGGDGADELFGGYPSQLRALQVHSMLKNIPMIARRSLSQMLLEFLPVDIRGYPLIHSLGTDFTNISSSFNPLFYKKEMKRLFNFSQMKVINALDTRPDLLSSESNIQTYLSMLNMCDFKSFLSEDILVKIDRASMAHSLEVRSPFLSKEIIEFAFTSVPEQLKIHQGRKKILLKLLGERVLPKEFIFERKQGFSLPIDQLLLQSEWSEYFAEKILNCPPEYINQNAALNILAKHRKGNFAGRKLYAIVQFIVWHDKNNNQDKV
jgi:asparagine synthase (glutamine-hydrolysing)